MDRKAYRRRRERRNRRSSGTIWIVLSALLLVVAGVGAGIYMKERMVQKSSGKKMERIVEETNEVKKPMAQRQMTFEEKCQAIKDKYGIEVPGKNLNFEEMRSGINSDIYAWLSIPGTTVDYPVVQHPTDNQYYLDYNLDGTKGYPGCIYSQTYNSTDFSDKNTILYGHNMNDGTMFGDLMKYKDKAFFDENSIIFVYTEDDIFVYRIVSARIANDEHLFLAYDYRTEAGMTRFISDMMEGRDLRNNYNTQEELGINNQFITLSTCVNEVPEERYLVQGVLLEV